MERVPSFIPFTRQETEPDAINFYRERDDYGFCSNFYKAPVVIDGKSYPTTEHYFQSVKFETTDANAAEKVRLARTASEAARIGRSRSHPLRKDWEDIKDDVMRKALLAKFTQHPDLKKQLMETGNAMLVEHTKNDSYWGDGGNSKGRNMLGKLLVELRTTFQKCN